MKLYSVKCNPLGIFNPPFHAENDLSAKYLIKRTLDVKDADAYLVQNPTDLSLWCLGSYDEKSGKIRSSLDCLCEDLSKLGKERNDG